MASGAVTLFLLFTIVMMVVKILMSFSKRKSYKFPPGPTPLPIIGNLNILDIKRQDLTFIELAKKYGTFFTFHLGPTKAVVLVGYEANKEALVKANYDFGNRGSIPIADNFQMNHGVVFSNGEIWKITRRFMLSILRDLGMGKKTVEGRIMDELQFLSTEIQSYNGKPLDKKILYLAAPNITFGILFGRRFDYDHPTFQKFISIMDELVINTGTPPAKIYNMFPNLKYFFKEPQLVLNRIDQLNVILKDLFNEAKEVKSEDSFRTFAEAFVQKDEREIVEDDKEKLFTEKNLLASAFDLMLGGTETTSTTIQWAILLMMKYPHLQKKAQEEIDNVIGMDRPPRWDDQTVLPYCLALVHEVQRYANIFQYFPHSTPTDVHFRDYFIPKGTAVIPVFSSVHYDETQYETPKQFNPNHFLDADGKFIKKDAFYPFSKGRRACAGESLARMELFLFITGLLQKFTFTPPPGISADDLDIAPEVVFSMRTKSYKLCATPRQ
ncbi:cytochrome P450 2W1-like [Anomaloglossus baeobatrachus]|uniref:cytochrome P450 2W1-like n=1 Tax=Anomaloglossus baeobatrachus TaxID=238106 RepID=UPI003F507361